MEIKVIDWVQYGSFKEDAPIGGMGGWFNAHLMEENLNPKPPHLWQDYLDQHHKDSHPYLEALKKEIIDNNMQTTGERHQYSSCGCPLFSDDTVGEFSYRAWGDLMAAIYSTKEKPLSYMAYYC